MLYSDGLKIVQNQSFYLDAAPFGFQGFFYRLRTKFFVLYICFRVSVTEDTPL